MPNASLLTGPIGPTLLRLAAPVLVVLTLQTLVGVAETYFVSFLGTAALAGWLALRWTGELSHVFLAQSLGLIAAGLINSAAVAGGAWFGSLRWPWSTAAALQKQSST
jgi:Na+-driven multidrug efflux pump